VLVEVTEVTFVVLVEVTEVPFVVLVEDRVVTSGDLVAGEGAVVLAATVSKWSTGDRGVRGQMRDSSSSTEDVRLSKSVTLRTSRGPDDIITSCL